MYFMLPAARVTSGNHGNGIYHNISLFVALWVYLKMSLWFPLI